MIYNEIELAIKLARHVHNICENVPHNIGLTLLAIIKKHEFMHNYRELTLDDYDENKTT